MAAISIVDPQEQLTSLCRPDLDPQAWFSYSIPPASMDESIPANFEAPSLPWATKTSLYVEPVVGVPVCCTIHQLSPPHEVAVPEPALGRLVLMLVLLMIGLARRIA